MLSSFDTRQMFLLLLFRRSQITCDDDDDNDDRIATQNSIFLLSIELRRKHLKQRRANILWHDKWFSRFRVIVVALSRLFSYNKIRHHSYRNQNLSHNIHFEVKMLYVLYNVIKLFDGPVYRAFKVCHIQIKPLINANCCCKQRERIALSICELNQFFSTFWFQRSWYNQLEDFFSISLRLFPSSCFHFQLLLFVCGWAFMSLDNGGLWDKCD